MLPHSHFIAGFFLGAVGYDIGLLSFWQVFLIGFLAVAVDLDHFISYWHATGDWNMVHMWNTCIEHMKHKSSVHRTLLHKWAALVILPIFVIIYFMSKETGYILLAAYGSHLLLDYAHVIKLAPDDYKIKTIGGIDFSYNTKIETFFLVTAILGVMLLI